MWKDSCSVCLRQLFGRAGLEEENIFELPILSLSDNIAPPPKHGFSSKVFNIEGTMIELMQLIGAILIWAFLWSKETKTQEYLMVFSI